MRSKLFSFTFAIVLGLVTPVVSAIVWTDVVAAQTVEEKKKEADRLLQQGLNQYQSSQFKDASKSWQQSLNIYSAIKDRLGEAQSLGNLGNSSLSLGDYTSSIEFHEKSLVVSRAIQYRFGEGAALGNLGLVYLKLGNYRKSIEFQKQLLVIAREISDRQSEGTALGNLGSIYSSLGEYDKAIDFQEQRLTITRKIQDRKGEEAALGNLGINYDALGKYEKAIEFQEKSLAIAHEIGDLSGQGNALGNLGVVYHALGKYEKAIEFQEKSLAIANEIGDQSSAGNSLGNIGNIYLSLGNYSKAINFQEQQLVISRKIGDRRNEGRALGSLGDSYYYLGKYSEAINFMEQCLVIAREINDKESEIISLSSLGGAYLSLKNYSKAIIFIEKSLVIARTNGDRTSEGSALGNLGLSYYYLKDYTKAISFLEQHLAIAREIKYIQGEENALGNLGIVYHALGNYPKAIEYQEKRLAIARSIKDRNGERIALNNIGEALKKQNQSDLAIVFYKQSVAVSETIRQDNRPLSRELQSSYTQTVAGTYRNLADLLLSQGRVLEAQQVLELLKNQELRDYTRETRSEKEPPTKLLNPLEQPIPAAFNDKIALGDRLTQCEQTQCSQLQLTQLNTQVKQANDNLDRLVDRLKKAFSNQYDDETKKKLIGPAQVLPQDLTNAAQNVILANPNRKTLLLYPLVLDDKLWLVWGSQAGEGGVVFDRKEIPVTRKTLSETVLKLQTLLSNPNSDIKELQTTSQQLYQWLIAPIRPQLDANKIQHIVFSLDRSTRYIPMAALHDGKQYLIENFSVSNILTIDSSNNTDRLSPKLSDNKILGLGLTRAIAPFSSLPGVETELNSIIKTDQNKDTIGIFPGTELMDEQFTEEALQNNISRYSILHIATHGSFTTNDPENSFLLLGNGKKLTMPSIKSMKKFFKTHLVVLSACETGKGGIDSEGMEVAGMGHYFLRGGAKSVLASLWLVNDPATALLMHNFYKTLDPTTQPSPSKAEALQSVQIKFLKRQLTDKEAKAIDRAVSGSSNRGVRIYRRGAPPPDSFEHPYYWAPFILIGNNL